MSADRGREMSLDVLMQSVLRADPRAIARAMSLVEDETAEGVALIERLHARTGRASVIGVTGPPGAGKSTLVDRLIGLLRRRGSTVGVLAVDPTSPFTGGAILGDRVRMSAHAADAGVFIRSVATRGHLGGLSRATADLVTILDAAGSDVVIVETVGVGQDEVEIVRTADVSIVVLVPGTGDDVQAIKAGIMEIGDVYVVNKADRDGADALVQAVSGMLAMQTYAPGDWRPPVLRTEAHTGAGLEAVWSAVEQFRARPSSGRAAREQERDRTRLRHLLVQQFLRRLANAVPEEEFERYVERIGRRELDPYTAAAAILPRVVGT